MRKGQNTIRTEVDLAVARFFQGPPFYFDENEHPQFLISIETSRDLSDAKVKNERHRVREREFKKLESLLVRVLANLDLGRPDAPDNVVQEIREFVELHPELVRMTCHKHELTMLVKECFSHGNQIEPMFGQGGVWWLMGNRMDHVF